MKRGEREKTDTAAMSKCWNNKLVLNWPRLGGFFLRFLKCIVRKASPHQSLHRSSGTKGRFRKQIECDDKILSGHCRIVISHKREHWQACCSTMSCAVSSRHFMRLRFRFSFRVRIVCTHSSELRNQRDTGQHHSGMIQSLLGCIVHSTVHTVLDVGDQYRIYQRYGLTWRHLTS